MWVSVSVLFVCVCFFSITATAIPTAVSGGGGGGEVVEEGTIPRLDVTVEINSGPIVGHHSIFSSAIKFLGIPFASPPLGNLRWKSPQPVTPWTNPRPAHLLPPSCAQQPNLLAWTKHISEDCLYLNVFMPLHLRASAAAVPVLVWFYGGSWEHGGTSLPLYDGEFDAAAHNVVVVTVNYRLGVFGFLGSEALVGPGQESTGNYGLLDQRAALLWVQSNIAQFGGDPNRVTIFGQSAGGGSVAAHLITPISNGLFHRAIIMSGPFASWTSRPLATAETEYTRLLNMTACPDVACLRALNTSILLEFDVATDSIWAPTVDGVVLTQDTQKMAAEGKFNAVPVIVGTVADEATTLINLPQNCTVQDYNNWLFGMFGPHTPDVAAIYPLQNYRSPWLAGVAAWTDASMICPARRTARWLQHPAGAPPVYLYHFIHVPEYIRLLKPALGSYHGAEIPFVFRFQPLDFTIGERRLANVMSTMWTNFAASGNPNSEKLDAIEGVPKWPVYDPSLDNNIVFDAGLLRLNISMQTGLRKTECDFWDLYV